MVSDDGLVSLFYPAPPAQGRRKAAVLMLGGSGGGFPYADAAADLAAAGHPTLALAYFQTPQRDAEGPAAGALRAAAGVPLQGDRLAT